MNQEQIKAFLADPLNDHTEFLITEALLDSSVHVDHQNWSSEEAETLLAIFNKQVDASRDATQRHTLFYKFYRIAKHHPKETAVIEKNVLRVMLEDDAYPEYTDSKISSLGDMLPAWRFWELATIEQIAQHLLKLSHSYPKKHSRLLWQHLLLHTQTTSSCVRE